jgi:anti-sigma regulatory factor (Ser/Thr protein kinase)
LDTQTQSGEPGVARRTGRFTRAGTGSDGGAAGISVEFDAGPSAAAWARNALFALDQRVDEEVLADVRLLVSELVTNSVRHSDVGPGDTVGLDVTLDARRIRVEVSDSGRGFEPRPRKPGQSKAGGWGLFLVDRLADRWGVARNHFTHVWFEIDRGRPRPAA